MRRGSKKREKREEGEEEEQRKTTTTEKQVDGFLEDVWSFVPLAALTNCFSNLIHASKDGIPANDDQRTVKENQVT